ncbi:MAG: hypothetical protein WB762_14210 [Candidatus Sulfotelmatobacter sp.]
MKWIIASCFFLSFCLSAIGQIETSGTVIAIDATQKELVIAADSRRGKTRHSYGDDVCKIATFDNRIIFAASGNTGPSMDPKIRLWDAYAIAQQQYRKLAVPKCASDTFIIRLAQAWGVAIKQQMEEGLRWHPEAIWEINDNYIISAIFAGVKANGDIIAVSESLSAGPKRNGVIQVVLDPVQVLKQSDYLWVLGVREIIGELTVGKTIRAQQWRRSINAAIKSGGDPLATLATQYVRITIDNLRKTRTDFKGTSFSEVGDPISVLRLTQNGAEWIQYGNCPRK